MKHTNKVYIPLFLVFLIVLVLTFSFKGFLAEKNIDSNFIIGADIILFLLSAGGLFLQSRGAKSANMSAFLRGIYSSLLMKMFLIVGAILVYVAILGGEVNRVALFISMALYFIFTGIEVSQIMKIVRRKSDG